jgi:hypothetical protein
MGNIFIKDIIGDTDFSIPTDDTELAEATSELDTILQGVSDFRYVRALAWVETRDGASAYRTLNCLVERFEYDTTGGGAWQECIDASEAQTLTGAIETALVQDHGAPGEITSIGDQDLHVYLKGEYYLWERDTSSGFLFTGQSGDDVTVGGSSPNGKWFDNGELVLGGTTVDDTEVLRVVGNERIEAGLLMTEQGSVPITTGAGEGTFWVLNTSPTLPRFTDDAGVSHTLAYKLDGESLEDIDQVIFVDKASGGSYTPDGTIQAPYNTVSAAITAAVTAGASASNRFGIIIYPGIYSETITLSTAGIFLIGTSRENTIIEQSSGAATVLTTTVSTIGLRNLTFRTTGTATGTLFTNSSAASTGYVDWINCDFEVASGASYLDFAQDINLRAWSCRFIHADDSQRIVDFATAAGCDATFWACTFEGQVYCADAEQEFHACRMISSASSNGTVYIGETVRLFECYVENTDTGANANAIVLAGNGGQALGCNLRGGANVSYDVTGASAYNFTASGCRLRHGLSSNVVMPGPFYWASGSDGDKDYYATVIDAKTQASSGEVIYMLADETSSSDLNAGTSTEIVIDGQGHTYTGSGSAIFTSEAADITFRHITLVGQIVFNTGDCVVRFEDVDLDGRIFWDVGTNNSHLYAHDSRLEGNATYPRPITFDSSANNGGSLIFDHCFIKGHTGNGAVYFTSNVDYDFLYFAWTKLFHGSLSTNNPFENGGTTARTYYAHHCTMNQEPALADPTYMTNAIDSGQRYNTIDPDGDYYWLS